MRFTLAILIVLIVQVCYGQDFTNILQGDPGPAAAGPVEVKRAPIPADAIQVVLQDIAQNPESAPFCRYVWVRDPTELKVAAVRTTFNMVMNRSGTLYQCPVVGGTVVKCDLRNLVSKEDQLNYLISTWDDRFRDLESYFLVNGPEVEVPSVVVVTSRQANIFSGSRTLGTVFKGREFEILDTRVFQGETWHKVNYHGDVGFVWGGSVSVKRTKSKVVRARTFAPYCGEEAGDILIATQSQVPIVRYDWFIWAAWSNLDGGSYYELCGILPAPSDSKITDYEHFLVTFAGVSEDDIDEIRLRMTEPRNKIAIFISGVTKKPRSVIIFRGLASKVVTNQGVVAVTQDMRDGDYDARADAMANLKKREFAAMEVFVETPTGIVFGLFAGDLNGDGKFDRNVTQTINGTVVREGELQRAAPDDVVSDFTVPDGYTKRLQAGISCIRCHSTIKDPATANDPEGWFHLKNDVQLLTESGLDVFGERDTGIPLHEDIEQLASLYMGDLSKPLGRARDDLAELLVRLTRIHGDPEEGGVTTQVFGEISRTYKLYYYTPVTPQTACYELGFEVGTREEAVDLLRRVLPPLPADELGISPEDVTLGGLKAGIDVNRFQWERVFADAHYRALNTLQKETSE